MFSKFFLLILEDKNNTFHRFIFDSCNLFFDARIWSRFMDSTRGSSTSSIDYCIVRYIPSEWRNNWSKECKNTTNTTLARCDDSIDSLHERSKDIENTSSVYNSSS